MTYRVTRKSRKVWSDQAIAKRAAIRMIGGCREPYIEIDPYIKITVERRGTGEIAVFECMGGTRIDNYTVYCNDQPQGVQSITTLMSNIRKALPRYKRID